MADNLAARLALIEDRVGGKIEHRLGVPQRQRPILFRTSLTKRRIAPATGFETTNTDLFIPHPKIENIPNKFVNLTFSQQYAGLLLTKNDLLIQFGKSPEINQLLEGFQNKTNNQETAKNIKIYVNANYNAENQVLNSFDFTANILVILDDSDEDITLWRLIARREYD